MQILVLLFECEHLQQSYRLVKGIGSLQRRFSRDEDIPSSLLQFLDKFVVGLYEGCLVCGIIGGEAIHFDTSLQSVSFIVAICFSCSMRTGKVDCGQ